MHFYKIKMMFCDNFFCKFASELYTYVRLVGCDKSWRSREQVSQAYYAQKREELRKEMEK